MAAEAKMRKSGDLSSSSSGIKSSSGDEIPAPKIRIPGTNEDVKDKPKKNLIQELKPEGESSLVGLQDGMQGYGVHQ